MPTPAQTSRGFRVNFLASGVWHLMAALLAGLSLIAWQKYFLIDSQLLQAGLADDIVSYFIFAAIVAFPSSGVDLCLALLPWQGKQRLIMLIAGSSSPWFAYNAMFAAIAFSFDKGTLPALIWLGTGIPLTLAATLLHFRLISDVNHNLWLLTWPLAVLCYLGVVCSWGFVAMMAFFFM